MPGATIKPCAAGAGPFGLTETAEAFAAGILQRLPALLAIGAPSVASYLRLVPSSWAGAYCCWGLENREAALRMITGSTGSSAWAANLEVKCIDLTANPYLVLAGLLAAVSIDSHARLPEPIDVDPAAIDEEVLDERGIHRLPTTLQSSVKAFAADDVLRAASGLARELDHRRSAIRDGAVRRSLSRGDRTSDPLGALSGPAATSSRGVNRSAAGSAPSGRHPGRRSL